MTDKALTVRQKAALVLLRRCESAQCASGPTWADKYTAWVNYQTAEALRARGLVSIGAPPDYEIVLTERAGKGVI
jgi:hypothetical protein